MIRRILYELTRGVAYRRIEHPEMKMYTVISPLVLSAVFVIFYLALPIKPALLGKDGVLTAALAVISTLPGFYFAGLAAVATFGNSSMDVEMPDPAPTVKIEVSGASVKNKLSRRMFLSYLFSYLVLIAFGICLIILIFNAAYPSIYAFRVILVQMQNGNAIWLAFKAIFVGIFSLFSSSMLVTTLHGMFFLTEKVHQP